MRKSIALVGLVSAFLLLCSAQTFRPAPKLYRAKPQDLPPWAEQGNFRFIRLDGGQLESWKAERTWWGKKFCVSDLAESDGREVLERQKVRGHIGDTISCFLLLLERHPVRPRLCSLLELRLAIPLSRR
jgi:hypothetical protein